MRRNIPPTNWCPRLRLNTLVRVNRPSIRAQSSKAASRIDRLTSKLPRRLQKYTNRLRNAPISHVVSFLILHEITAVVPVIGLFGLFHYTEHVPVSYMTAHFGGYVHDGVVRFEKYFKRKGWFGFGKDDGLEQASVLSMNSTEQSDNAMERWESGDGRYRVVVEVALAYAITKALLPLRIIGSVWATPWFAGVLVRARGAFARRP
ncbi:hypothetical protein G7046_g6529 [Stylonectria norvegica]|nr:hypothetical protein G7046_g6529 [Stylonectria norvegica]